MVKMGYIFSGCEVLYLAKLMGAGYIFNMGIDPKPKGESIAENAKRSLVNKNYVFRDFSGNLILGEELRKLLLPFAAPEKIIALRRKNNGFDVTAVRYIRGGDFVKAEPEPHRDDSFIFTAGRISELGADILGDISEDTEDFEGKGARFIITADQFRILMDMTSDGRDAEAASFIETLNIKGSAAEELMAISRGKDSFISLCFYDDYIKRPHKLDYLVYYLTEKGCRRVDGDRGGGENIAFSSVNLENIKQDIYERLRNGFNIRIGSRSGLFD